jgi:hypothetical protein
MFSFHEYDKFGFNVCYKLTGSKNLWIYSEAQRVIQEVHDEKVLENILKKAVSYAASTLLR